MLGIFKKKKKGDLLVRLTVAKLLGFIAGLVCFFLLPKLIPGASLFFLIGMLLWFTLFGAIIGLVGIMDKHPLWDWFKMPFWFRGTYVGAFMNLVIVFLAYDQFAVLMGNYELAQTWGMSSPFWFVLDGAILGLLIDWIATKYGGEGKALVK